MPFQSLASEILLLIENHFSFGKVFCFLAWPRSSWINYCLPLGIKPLRLSTFDSIVSPWRSTEKVVSMVGKGFLPWSRGTYQGPHVYLFTKVWLGNQPGKQYRILPYITVDWRWCQTSVSSFQIPFLAITLARGFFISFLRPLSSCLTPFHIIIWLKYSRTLTYITKHRRRRLEKKRLTTLYREQQIYVSFSRIPSPIFDLVLSHSNH